MDTWDCYFMAVCSIRFHPANTMGYMDDAAIRREVDLAVLIVQHMMEARDECRSLPPQ